MSEQYEDPDDGFFEAPAPLPMGPTDKDEQYPEGSKPPVDRVPLAPIKARPIETGSSDDVVRPERIEPSGAHRLRKGMVLNGNILEAPLGGGKSADVWQASHPTLGATLVKVVQDPAFPTLDIKRADPATFAALQRTFEDFESFHKQVMESLTPQLPGDGALLKPLDMGRTSEGRIFKISKFLSHEEVTSTGRVARRSKDSRDPAPPIDKVKANKWDAERKLRLVRSALLSLWQLHKQNYVHGDIKPANILAVNTPSGYVARLIDFDNCFLSGSPFDSTLIGGDEAYFSPERAAYQDGDLDDASTLALSSDLFSLSLVMHKVFTEKGELPKWTLGKGNAGECCSKGGTPKYLPLGLHNDRLEELFKNCLRLNPNHRPTTYDLLVASGVYLERGK
jgi:hypothetical protein